ncbi:MAG: hypothetical protein JRH20_24930, partial [Deltaproteobacteria bacterium]|nr:hypothetical protein [Deltaproteobacteria bacterium]
MKTIYLTKYAQSRFGKLGNVNLETMLKEAGTADLDDIDRDKIEHIAVAGLLAPLL